MYSSKEVTYVNISNICTSEINKNVTEISTKYILFTVGDYINDVDIGQMIRVLELNEHHGLVYGAKYSAVEGFDDNDFDIAPFVQSLPVLVKTTLIGNFGPFNTKLSDFSEAIIDFSIHINNYGYTTIRTKINAMSNRILLSSEFTSYLENKYKWLSAIENIYKNDIYEIDEFCKHPTILINLYRNLPILYNGTSLLTTSIVRYILSNANGYNVFVLCEDRDVLKFHGLDDYDCSIISLEDLRAQYFDLVFSPSSIISPPELIRIMQSARKSVVMYLDSIMLRSFYLRKDILDFAYTTRRFQLEFCDRIIFISKSAYNDAINLFNMKPLRSGQFKEILLGYLHEDNGVPDVNSLLEPISQLVKSKEKYIFIFGNNFKHKMVVETIDSLTGNIGPIATVVLSDHTYYDVNNRIYYLRSGNVCAPDMELLHRNASLYIYPSVYEGFGLPIAEAAKRNIPIILYSSDVSHEVSELYPSLNVRFFSEFREIPGFVNELVNTQQTDCEDDIIIRQIDDANEEIWQVIIDELAMPVDYNRLKSRINAISDLRNFYNAGMDKVLQDGVSVIPFLKIRAKRFIRKIISK